MSDKIEQTLEDEIIEWYSKNKPVVFQDIMERFKVNELYAKTFLLRVKQNHIKIE